jgi:hypothetical protein
VADRAGEEFTEIVEAGKTMRLADSVIVAGEKNAYVIASVSVGRSPDFGMLARERP